MRLSRTSRRPGTITIIVVAFLLLLLLMGLTFAFYGLREAEEARVYRDSQNGGQTGVGADPSVARPIPISRPSPMRSSTTLSLR